MLDEDIKDDNPLKINGSVFLAIAESKEEVRRLLEQDIYYRAEVWNRERIQIVPVCPFLSPCMFLVVEESFLLTRVHWWNGGRKSSKRLFSDLEK